MPGNQVKNWDQYHALRRKGKSKEQAAKITNAVSKGQHRARGIPVTDISYRGQHALAPHIAQHAKPTRVGNARARLRPIAMQYGPKAYKLLEAADGIVKGDSDGNALHSLDHPGDHRPDYHYSAIGLVDPFEVSKASKTVNYKGRSVTVSAKAAPPLPPRPKLGRQGQFKHNLIAGTAAGTAAGGAALAARPLAPKVKTLAGKTLRAVNTPAVKRTGRHIVVGAVTGAVVGAANKHRNSQVAKSNDPFELSKLSDTQLRHRKRVQAGLSATTATIGLTALGAKGAGPIVRRTAKPATAKKITAVLDRQTNNALVAGAGIGGVAGFNSASISRAEAKRPHYQDHIHKDWSDFDRKRQKQIVRQYGLRGAPSGVSREKRQEIWEARAKHLNRKRNRWDKSSKIAGGAEKTSSAVAAGTGAVIAAHQIRERYRNESPANARRLAQHAAEAHRKLTPHIGSKNSARVVETLAHKNPGYKTLALAGGAAVTAAGARRMRIVANKKTRKYSSASGGIAAGTANRMKNYSIGKSAFGVDHS